MKKHIMLFASAVFFLSWVGCTSDDPQIRVRNEQPDKANIQLQTTGGNTININDVGTGLTTDYRSVAEGNVDATAVIQNESVSPTASFKCEMDSRYTIVILNSKPPAIRIDR